MDISDCANAETNIDIRTSVRASNGEYVTKWTLDTRIITLCSRNKNKLVFSFHVESVVADSLMVGLRLSHFVGN